LIEAFQRKRPLLQIQLCISDSKQHCVLFAAILNYAIKIESFFILFDRGLHRFSRVLALQLLRLIKGATCGNSVSVSLRRRSQFHKFYFVPSGPSVFFE
jgi:hypothetical protein